MRVAARWLAAMAFAAALAMAWPAAAQTVDRRIAVTIDDLPWARAEMTAPQALLERHGRLIAALREARVPVIGFVNEDKLELDGNLQPARVQLLRDWLDAGFDLGNHTYSHRSLHDIGAAAFGEDTLKGERQLKPLMAQYGRQPRWFRHPYLRAGRDAAERTAVEDFLRSHGYRVAPVTVDNSEWIWAFAYANVMDGRTPVEDRPATLRRLREGYVPYMLNKLDYYERQSIELFGRNIPHVWLMHANELNADAFVELMAATRRRGYRMVPLDEAMRDPAYGHADGYAGQWGPSWIHRWAMAEKKPREFYRGEPAVPRWVMELAGVESE